MCGKKKKRQKKKKKKTDSDNEKEGDRDVKSTMEQSVTDVEVKTRKETCTNWPENKEMLKSFVFILLLSKCRHWHFAGHCRSHLIRFPCYPAHSSHPCTHCPCGCAVHPCCHPPQQTWLLAAVCNTQASPVKLLCIQLHIELDSFAQLHFASASVPYLYNFSNDTWFSNVTHKLDMQDYADPCFLLSL